MNEPLVANSDTWQQIAAEFLQHAPCGGYCEDPGSQVYVCNLTVPEDGK